jgi:hypothetical protein
MAKKKQTRAVASVEDSTMSAEVSARNNFHPSHYSNSYKLDMGTGMIIPRTQVQATRAMPAIQLSQATDGTITAYIPPLATGVAGLPMIGQQVFDPDSFCNWDTPIDDRDGRGDMRKSLMWWRRDPLVFRCVRLLVQLSNSRIIFSGDDDSARQQVQMWFDQAMPASFRKQFFLEYFRTAMVPVLKTLIPYEPRRYKQNKIP